MAEPDQLNRLYREMVLDHSRHPHNFRKLPTATHSATGHNPLCGDQVSIFLQLDGTGTIADAAFEAAGCAISVASASMLTDLVRGKRAGEANTLVERVNSMLAGSPADPGLGQLTSLSGVRSYPSRIRCATLPWRTLEAALNGSASAPVSTEDET